MVKITVDLIEQCAQYTNAVKEREIDLRGYKISLIENMGATLVCFGLVFLLMQYISSFFASKYLRVFFIDICS